MQDSPFKRLRVPSVLHPALILERHSAREPFEKTPNDLLVSHRAYPRSHTEAGGSRDGKPQHLK